MTTISLHQMPRIINRLGETRAAAETPASVAASYDATVGPLVAAYTTSDTATVNAGDTLRIARKAADAAVVGFEKPYGAARAIVRASVGDITVPETLGSLTPLTDAKAGITTLLGIVNAHAAEPWAAAVLAEDFGTLAPDVLRKLDAAIVAKSADEAAIAARNEALDALYPKLVLFKEVVRRAFGRSSIHYRGLAFRVTRPAPVPNPEPPAPVATVTAKPIGGNGVHPALAASAG